MPRVPVRHVSDWWTIHWRAQVACWVRARVVSAGEKHTSRKASPDDDEITPHGCPQPRGVNNNKEHTA